MILNKDWKTFLLMYAIYQHESKCPIIYCLVTRLNKDYIIIKIVTHKLNIFICISIHMLIRGICGMTSYRDGSYCTSQDSIAI